MAKEWAKAFYNSAAWDKCRSAYIAYRVSVDGGLCEVCGKRPGKIVHHKEKLTPANIDDPEVSLNHSRLRFECKECHDDEEEHFNSMKNKNKLMCAFDSDGNPLPLHPPVGR